MQAAAEGVDLGLLLQPHQRAQAQLHRLALAAGTRDLHRLPHQGVVNDDVRAYDTHRGAPGLAHQLLIGSAPGRPMVGGRVKGDTSQPAGTLAPRCSASDERGRPLTRPPPAEASYAEPSMASQSRKIRLQQFSAPLLEALAFCSERHPRLAELAAQALFEQQLAAPAVPCPAWVEEEQLPW